MIIQNIVIGTPLVPLTLLLEEDYEKFTIFETERFLPELLLKYNFIKSKSELRRNRPELWIQLDKPDFLEIKIGKKRLWVVVGE
jgi:hypothetical protein